MPGELQIPQWEWLIVFYFFVGGIAGGAYFTAAVIELVGEPEDRPLARAGYLIAFPLAVLGALLLTLDLGMPQRFWHMLVYRKSLLPWPKWDSPISVGAYGLLVFGLFSSLSFLEALVQVGRLRWAPLRLRPNSLARKLYAVLGGLAGYFLAGYTGVLLATTHLPMWAGTSLLGALFLASGASTGMAAIALVLAITRTPVAASAWAKLESMDAVTVLVELVLLVAFVIALTMQGFTWSVGTLVLLIGITLGLGLVAPLVIQVASGGRQRAALGLTAVLILLGGFALRMAIVLGGQGLL
jgi:formate-dependent nitrite reductase membrane component NrfD